MSSDGFVYVMGADHGPVKVGWTVNIEKRLADVQTGYPYDLKVLFSIEHIHARFVEAEAHRRLAAHRLRGEWFDVPRDVAIEAVQSAVGHVDAEPPAADIYERGDWTGAMLAGEMKQLGLSEEDLAVMAGKSLALVKSWLRERRPMPRSVITLLDMLRHLPRRRRREVITKAHDLRAGRITLDEFLNDEVIA